MENPTSCPHYLRPLSPLSATSAHRFLWRHRRQPSFSVSSAFWCDTPSTNRHPSFPSFPWLPQDPDVATTADRSCRHRQERRRQRRLHHLTGDWLLWWAPTVVALPSHHAAWCWCSGCRPRRTATADGPVSATSSLTPGAWWSRVGTPMPRRWHWPIIGRFGRWVITAMLGLGPESAQNCSCIFQFPDFFDLNSRKIWQTSKIHRK
jgi:hypothetical protein